MIYSYSYIYTHVGCSGARQVAMPTQFLAALASSTVLGAMSFRARYRG